MLKIVLEHKTTFQSSKIIFPAQDSLFIPTLHMHIFQNISPLFVKFAEQLDYPVLNNFRVEHFCNRILYEPQKSRSK